MMKRREFLAMTVAGAVLAGCGGENPPGGGSSAAGGGDRKYTIAVLPKGVGHQFWLTVRSGADAAGKDLNANIIWNGPDKETEIAKQINIVQDMISRKVDAIVMAACDENALIDVVHQALDAGIPVITIDSGVKSDRPLSFVATDNVAAARMAAEHMNTLLGGKASFPSYPVRRRARCASRGSRKASRNIPTSRSCPCCRATATRRRRCR